MVSESDKRFGGASRRRRDKTAKVNSRSTGEAGSAPTAEGHRVTAALRDQVAKTSAKPSRKRRTVTFGWVKLRDAAPPPEEIARNIASGNSALSRAANAFARPGVKLPRAKNVPLYRADAENPRILIRELDGRSERVTLVDGEFKLAE